MLKPPQVMVKVISPNLAELFTSTAIDDMELELCESRLRRLYKTVSMPARPLLPAIASITKRPVNAVLS